MGDDSEHSTNGDQISVGDIRDNVAVAIGRGAKAIVNVFSGEHDARYRRNLLILLEKVNSFWVHGVLENSVHSAAWIELGKQAQGRFVEHPWELVLCATDETSDAVIIEQKIMQIFDEAGQSMLILGEPGSGKTMTLLELARELIAQAVQDPSLPIPVVLNLSSWTEKRADLINWLVEELNTKYQIPRKMGRYWVENDVLALLLDGLDEVKVEQRNACVGALNQFRQEHGLANIVVCSRLKEYDELKNRLKLNSAILIQPLTPEQIDRYLVSGGPSLATLHQAVQTDAGMQELAQSPLMLSIMSLVYQGLPPDEVIIEKTESNRQHKRLFDAYVKKMFARTTRTQQRDFPESQTISRLSWLAQKMTQHNQTVFLIEQMQPSWLSSELQQWFYLLASRSICGLLIGLPVGLIFWKELGFSTGILSGIIGGLVAGMVTGLGILWSKHRAQARPSIWPFLLPNTTKTITNVLSIMTSVGLSTFIIIYIGYSRVLSEYDAQIYSLLYYSSINTAIFIAVLVSISFGMLFGLKAHGQDLRQDIQTIEALSWSWSLAIQRAKKGIVVGLVLGLLVGLIVVPIIDYSYRSTISAFTEIIEGDPSLQNTVETLNKMNNGILPIFTICLFIPLLGTLGSVMSFIVGGLFGGLQATLVQVKVKPNEGIRLSIRNATVITLFIGLPIGLIVGLIGGANWSVTMITMLFVGLPVFLWYGGLAIIQHYALRLILFLKGYTPWNYTRFLDYSAERIFLRKVGGGYIFIHRFLQEYFASLPTSSIQAHKATPPG